MVRSEKPFTRMTFVIISLLLLVGASPVSAKAAPLILPGPNLEPGKGGWLEIAAPRQARSCSMTFHGAHRSYGPYRVGLGGPTRSVRWTIEKNARGTWRARLSCRTGGRRARALGSYARKVVIKEAGQSRGRLVKRGSVQIGRGSIPEMPSDEPSARLSVALPSAEVDLDDQRPGMEFHTCSTSKWMSKTRAIGEGVASKVEFAPTEEAHGHARSAQLNPITGLRGLSESYGVYGEMWEDLNRCQPFPPGLTDSQRHVIYSQMACHAYYGVSNQVGGNSWSFESWLQDVPWHLVLNPRYACQWDTLPASDGAISGFMRTAQGQHVRSSLEEDDHFDTWVIDNAKRRRLTTFKAYDCLIAKGNPARLYPGEFLNDYLPRGLPDVNPEEVCSTPSGSPGGGTATPSPPLSTTRQMVVDNRVTNGSTAMREDTPAYLSTVTRNFCKRDGCALPGTDIGSGAVITAECTVIGDRTTNGQDNSTIDDGNPGLYTSSRWYGIRWGDGRFGYISEAWIRADFRGGLGLRNC